MTPARPLRPPSALLVVALMVLGAALSGCGDAPGEQSTETTSMSSPAPVAAGEWSAELAVPGGPLRFGLVFAEHDQGLRAWIVNGAERIDVPRVTWEAGTLTLHIDHYDSRLTATPGDGGRRLAGLWTKRRGAGSWAELPFAATHASVAAPDPWPPPPPPVRASLTGRFAVHFEGDDDPAVGLFHVAGSGAASGTFLTTTGDYRYLSGGVTAEGRLELSAFDGAHAFLFHLTGNGAGPGDGPRLSGRFWSGDWFEQAFTARPDSEATVADPLAGTRFTGLPDEPLDLGALRFPDLDGVVRGLDDPAFAGRARLIQLFGSWCPNCSDACALLAELHEAYADRGLSIVGLAFELTGDAERDAEQVRRYAARHGVTWPLLVAGLADKAEAGKAVPFLDRVRSFPTTVFLHGDGRVRAVWQGFAGPATGSAHADLRATFEELIEELLAGAPADGAAPAGVAHPGGGGG